MNKESLEQLRNALVPFIQTQNIDLVDMCELMMNVDHFLDPKEYDDNIKTLQKRKVIKKEGNNYGRY